MDFACVPHYTASFMEPTSIFLTKIMISSGLIPSSVIRSCPDFMPSFLENSLKQVIRRATMWESFLHARHCVKYIVDITASILTTQGNRNYYVHFREVDLGHVQKLVDPVRYQVRLILKPKLLTTALFSAQFIFVNFNTECNRERVRLKT